MKIGIIVHSATGNTYSVALKLHQKLLELGHEADIVRLDPVFDDKNKSKVRFDKIPETEKYDALVFGGPVNGFSISAVLAAFLKQVKSLQNKQVACMVTQKFANPMLGGNHTIKQIKQLAEAKGAKVIQTGIVNWDNHRREQMIDDVVEKISRALSK